VLPRWLKSPFYLLDIISVLGRLMRSRLRGIKAKSIKSNKLRLIIMSDLGAPVREYQVSPRLLTFSFAIFCMILITFGAASYFVAQEYMDNKTVVASLYKENGSLIAKTASQDIKISDLQHITSNMLEKIETIESLNSEVRSMVGLEEGHDGQEQIVAGYAVSRGESVLDQVNEASDEQKDSLEDLKQELYDMDLKMTEQAMELLLLKDDVDMQLAFEAALPSAWPMEGVFLSAFGNRRDPINRKLEFHQGIDIANRTGTKIIAAGDGVVTFAGYRSGWGRMIMISHGYGYVSQYAHCSTLNALEGQTVARGDIIAKCGSSGRTTGSHLHYGIQYHGEFIDPMRILTHKN